MHLTLKKKATKPAAANVLQQQARFDAFVDEYNPEWPHHALAMKVPADLYVRSARVYRGLEEAHVSLPRHDDHRHALRPQLFQGKKSESQSRLRRAERRRHPGRGPHLARELYGVLPWRNS